jgi:2'-5' RNA ligase
VKKLRLFVALDLPAPARAALAAFRAAAADPEIWRPLPDEALHLTLAFLGHRPETDVPKIVEVLESAPMHAPRLALGSALALPAKRPRVLTAEVDDPHGSLRALQRAVSDGLAARRLYAPEARPYRPHATVARLRPDAKARRGELPNPEPLEFRGEALTLYRSQLRREGARYESLASFPLSH